LFTRWDLCQAEHRLKSVLLKFGMKAGSLRSDDDADHFARDSSVAILRRSVPRSVFAVLLTAFICFVTQIFAFAIIECWS